MDLGTGGSDLEDDALAESFAPEGQVALRSAAVVEQPAGDNVLAAAQPRSGSGYSGQPVTAFRSPRVVVGNGRIPGTHVPRPGSAPDAVLVADAPVSPAAVPAAPTAIEINIPPLPRPLPPVERMRPAVAGRRGVRHRDGRYGDRSAGRAGRLDPDTRCRRRTRLPTGEGRPVVAGVTPYVGPCAGSCPTPTSGSRR